LVRQLWAERLVRDVGLVWQLRVQWLVWKLRAERLEWILGVVWYICLVRNLWAEWLVWQLRAERLERDFCLVWCFRGQWLVWAWFKRDVRTKRMVWYIKPKRPVGHVGLVWILRRRHDWWWRSDVDCQVG